MLTFAEQVIKVFPVGSFEDGVRVRSPEAKPVASSEGRSRKSVIAHRESDAAASETIVHDLIRVPGWKGPKTTKAEPPIAWNQEEIKGFTIHRPNRPKGRGLVDFGR